MPRLQSKNIATRSILLHFFEPSSTLDGFEFVDVKKIKKIKNKSVKECFIGDLLDYIKDDKALILLKEIVAKLCDNGKLYIQSNDANSLCLAMTLNHINLPILKNMLFLVDKKNIYNIIEIKKIIDQTKGLSIDKYRFINNIQYYIECTKDA